MKKIYGYARVSSKEQNLDRQVEALKKYGVEERDIITDKQSAETILVAGLSCLITGFGMLFLNRC